MRVNPKIMKKRIAEKRRELAKAIEAMESSEARYEKASQENHSAHFLHELRGEFMADTNTVSKIEEEITKLEDELFGTWRPKCRENPPSAPDSRAPDLATRN